MKPLSFQDKMAVLDYYLQGLSADKVTEKTGVSKGAVISIIKDAREGRYPQLELKGRIDELHALAVRLRKENFDLTRARLGFGFLQRLLNVGVEVDVLEEWLDLCHEISPTPPEGFIPAAMELRCVGEETGLSYSKLATRVKELDDKRQRLSDAAVDLEVKETRYAELKVSIEENEKSVSRLRVEREKLEAEATSLKVLIEQCADEFGIPANELEAKLRKLINLDQEIAKRRSEHNRLGGEVDALSQRWEKLSSQMGKASTDFEEDIKLLKQVRLEVAALAEMKGEYNKEVENLEWATEVLPFLSDSEGTSDDDFSLISAVVNCVDRWIRLQPEWRLSWYNLKWGDIKRYVESKRA
jgi:hypothetical protein